MCKLQSSEDVRRTWVNPAPPRCCRLHPLAEDRRASHIEYSCNRSVEGLKTPPTAQTLQSCPLNNNRGDYAYKWQRTRASNVVQRRVFSGVICEEKEKSRSAYLSLLIWLWCVCIENRQVSPPYHLLQWFECMLLVTAFEGCLDILTRTSRYIQYCSSPRGNEDCVLLSDTALIIVYHHSKPHELKTTNYNDGVRQCSTTTYPVTKASLLLTRTRRSFSRIITLRKAKQLL